MAVGKKRPGASWMIDPVKRISERIVVNSTTGCWQWQGVLDKDGYGKMRLEGYQTGAHRVAYMVLVGPIPEGLELDHLCRNRACVNPHHLEPVEGIENWRRGNSAGAINARKTHCKHGHEFTPENTWHNGKGRVCRQCMRDRTARYQAKRKGLAA